MEQAPTPPIPATIMRTLPSMVKNELAKMSQHKQHEFLEEYNRKVKSTGIAYLLWFLLGWHYMYQRKWGLQFIFWFTVGGLFIWWALDAFRMPQMIADYNKDVAIEALKHLKAVSS